MKEDYEYRDADIQVNHIKALYIQSRISSILSREELYKNNITKYFWQGIIGAIKHNEILNIAIRGKTGGSKSTTGCMLLQVAVITMMKQGIIKKMTGNELQEYLYERICSDQTEFLRFAMKQKEKTAALTDEYSSLGETGFNATTEIAQYNEHSDLFAQDAIKVKIFCTPRKIYDHNADIILDYVGMDEEKGISQFLLSFREPTEYMPYPLGIVNFNVTETMKMPFYIRYRKKKFARLKLLKEHGLPNIRQIEFAQITIGAYKKLSKVATLGRISEDDILPVVESVKRDYKMQYSILALSYVIKRVKGLLNTETRIAKLRQALDKEKDEVRKDIIREGLKDFMKIRNDNLKEEEEKIRVGEEYANIK